MSREAHTRKDYRGIRGEIYERLLHASRTGPRSAEEDAEWDECGKGMERVLEVIRER